MTGHTGTAGLAAILLASTLIGVALTPLFVAAADTVDDLTTRFTTIMTETMDYLDRAWEVAKMFRDPNYDYDPSDLGNFTLPEMPGGEG